MDGRRWWTATMAWLGRLVRGLRPERVGPGRRFLNGLVALMARRWLLPVLGTAAAWLARSLWRRRTGGAAMPRRPGADDVRTTRLAMEVGREILRESGLARGTTGTGRSAEEREPVPGAASVAAGPRVRLANHAGGRPEDPPAEQQAGGEESAPAEGLKEV